MQEEFKKFQKIPRLSREMIITEKIDGTNAQLLITEDGDIFAGSRNRWVPPDNDNYGFARWVEGNKQELLQLGPGRHFGEWWGSGIQRGYNLPKGEKRLSLFNVSKWVHYDSLTVPEGAQRLPEIVSVVPTLYAGMFDTYSIEETLADLAINGSYAAPGFMDPEGIIIYHVAGGYYFKKTIKDDHQPKSI
jgi:hypothetical protein